MTFRTASIALVGALAWNIPALADTGLPDVQIRSVPIIGFFPYSGTSGLDGIQLNTYVVGFGVDFINIDQPYYRLSIIDASMYLFGANLSTLNPTSPAQSINTAYFRIGPHLEFANFEIPAIKTPASIGAQVGLGGLFLGSIKNVRTDWQSGLDTAITLTLYPTYEPPPIQRSAIVNAATPTWQGTDIQIMAGQKANISASGIYNCGGGPTDRPDGKAPGTGQVPTLNSFAVLGRIGAGQPFLIGSSTQITANASGELFLLINDNYYADNSGTATVDVTVYRH